MLDELASAVSRTDAERDRPVMRKLRCSQRAKGALLCQLWGAVGRIVGAANWQLRSCQ